MDGIFSIDGEVYSVGVESVKRTASIREGSNGATTISGKIIRDVIGTYYDYTVTLSVDMLSMDDYDSLYEVLTSPADSHMVVMPYGQTTITILAGVYTVSDVLELMADDNYWGSLEIKFTALEPQKE